MAIANWTRAGVLLGLLSIAATGTAQDSRTFTGVITDERCGLKGHAAMGMGPTDAECARACADEHGEALVLVDGEHVYLLSDQKRSREFAGTKVKVVGVLDAKTSTIRVTSIAAG
jgi:hypothetical protein